MVIHQERTKLMKGAEAQNRKNLSNIYSHSYKSARVFTDLTRKLLMAVYGKRDSRFTPCKRIQDSLGFWIPDSRYWETDSLSVERGFRILIVSGIPDSWVVFRIPKPRIQDSTAKRSCRIIPLSHESWSFHVSVWVNWLHLYDTRSAIVLWLM